LCKFIAGIVFFACILKCCFIIYRFEFVKAAGTCIVPINPPWGQELDGKMLKHIAGAGPVYLRAMEEIDTDQVYIVF
jgi:hypothetical protein